jgi:hypothetical protein
LVTVRSRRGEVRAALDGMFRNDAVAASGFVRYHTNTRS